MKTKQTQRTRTLWIVTRFLRTTRLSMLLWHNWNSWTNNRENTWSPRCRADYTEPLERSTDISINMRADKVQRLSDWKFWQKFEHISDEDGDSAGCLQEILGDRLG